MTDPSIPEISLSPTAQGAVEGPAAAPPPYAPAVAGSVAQAAPPPTTVQGQPAHVGQGAQGGYEMAANPERIEQFRAEIDKMHVKGTNGSAERWLLIIGVLLSIVGLVLAILGAVQVVNAGDSPPDQRAAMASGSLLGMVMVIAGAAVFLRYSMGRYLRFWLIRMVYEGHSDADRIVDAIDRAAGPDPSTLPPRQ
jgi:hypothetical protein